MRYFRFFVALVLIPLSDLQAQEDRLLEPGVRVRVSTAPPAARPDWIVGTAVAVTGDHLTIRLERDSGREIELARTAVTRLEVSRSQHSKWLTGLGLGFLAGAAVGGAIGYAELHEGHDLSTRDAALVGAVPGALVGALIGGVGGAAIRVDRWHVVPLATVSRADFPGHHVQFIVSLRISP